MGAEFRISLVERALLSENQSTLVKCQTIEPNGKVTNWKLFPSFPSSRCAVENSLSPRNALVSQPTREQSRRVQLYVRVSGTQACSICASQAGFLTEFCLRSATFVCWERELHRKG